MGFFGKSKGGRPPKHQRPLIHTTPSEEEQSVSTVASNNQANNNREKRSLFRRKVNFRRLDEVAQVSQPVYEPPKIVPLAQQKQSIENVSRQLPLEWAGTPTFTKKDETSKTLADSSPFNDSIASIHSESGGKDFSQFVFDQSFQRIEMIATETSDPGSNDFTDFIQSGGAAKLAAPSGIQDAGHETRIEAREKAKQSFKKKKKSMRSTPANHISSTRSLSSKISKSARSYDMSPVPRHHSSGRSVSSQPVHLGEKPVETMRASALQAKLERLDRGQKTRPPRGGTRSVSSRNSNLEKKRTTPSRSTSMYEAPVDNHRRITPARSVSSQSERERGWAPVASPGAASKDFPVRVVTASDQTVISNVSLTGATVTSSHSGPKGTLPKDHPFHADDEENASIPAIAPSPSISSFDKEDSDWFAARDPFASVSSTAPTPTKTANSTTGSINEDLIQSIRKAASKESSGASRQSRPDPPSPVAFPRSTDLVFDDGKHLPDIILDDRSAERGSPVAEEDDQSSSAPSIGPQKVPPKGLPKNAILASMLFRQTGASMERRRPKSFDDDDESVDVYKHKGVPHAISTDDTADSSVSSVTEEASSFYHKAGWKKQAHAVLNHYHEQSRREMAVHRRPNEMWLERVEEEHMHLFSA